MDIARTVHGQRPPAGDRWSMYTPERIYLFEGIEMEDCLGQSNHGADFKILKYDNASFHSIIYLLRSFLSTSFALLAPLIVISIPFAMKTK